MIKLDYDKCKKVLDSFLSLPIDDSTSVLKLFSSLPGAISCFDGKKRNYVFVPGNRNDKIILAAHADTVWDQEYTEEEISTSINFKNGIYSSSEPCCGIGADDRAGCAMLWILREYTGHSILILDGEEYGQIGAHHLMKNDKMSALIGSHNYIIQLDRCGSNDYKTYNIPVTDEFIEFVEKETGYLNAGNRSRTDIVALCKDICGVNFSIGYHNEHSAEETLCINEWYHTLEIVSAMISKPQKRFETVK